MHFGSHTNPYLSISFSLQPLVTWVGVCELLVVFVVVYVSPLTRSFEWFVSLFLLCPEAEWAIIYDWTWSLDSIQMHFCLGRCVSRAGQDYLSIHTQRHFPTELLLLLPLWRPIWRLLLSTCIADYIMCERERFTRIMG